MCFFHQASSPFELWVLSVLGKMLVHRADCTSNPMWSRGARERERERKRARERERERERERLKLALNMFLTSLLMAAHVLVPVALFTRHIGVSNLAADGGAPCVLQSLLGRKVSGNRPPCSAKHA